ncbi:MAG: DUF2203 family protein [Planctomycetota bacterium]
MTTTHLRNRKSFTVQEANAALPLVRAIVRDLTELSSEVIERRERLSTLLVGRRHDAHDPYRQELAHVEEELENDTERLREFVGELHELGVEPKSVTEGLVDFPSMLDGRPVCLCWKLGEPEVLYWYERGATFHDRQPLAAASAAGDDGAPGDGHTAES